MKRIRALLFCFAPLLVYAADSLPLTQSYPAKEHAPTSAKLTLRLPPSVMIGEEIPAALVVENTGKMSFEISTGGDYRSTGYPQRMKVRVLDSHGTPLPELPREAFGFGGGGIIAPTPPIQPGESSAVEFPLECYVSFQKAGAYRILAGHDLGWIVDANHPHPLATATLQVTEPTAAQAEAHVEKLFAARTPASANHVNRFEDEYRFEKQLCVLRHPVYLAPLSVHATGGSKAAVRGIGHIATTDATQALIQLLQHDSTEIVVAAAQQILHRLPTREDHAKRAMENWSSRYQIDPLLPVSWTPAFEKPLFDATLKMLESTDADVVHTAALVMKARGEPEHAPAILDALQRFMAVYQPPRTGPDANTLDAPKPQQMLIHALDALRQRGWRTNGGRQAETVAWFRQLADSTAQAPSDDSWKERVLAGIENGPATLRMAALQAIPQPMPDAFVQPLLRALEDHDSGVQRVACEAAGKSKNPVFAQPLVQIVELAPETFLQNAAVNAAYECGARYELWCALATVIPNEKQMIYALRTLVEGTIELPDSKSGGGNSGFTRDQRFAIRQAWRLFLTQHQEVLVTGNRVQLTDPDTIAALTGMDFRPDAPAITIRFSNGTEWPHRL